MIQPGGGPCLAHESLAKAFFLTEIDRQKFQCDLTVELGVLGFIDHSHSTLAQLLQDFIMRYCFAYHFALFPKASLFISNKTQDSVVVNEKGRIG
jgi:hypothetical protein